MLRALSLSGLLAFSLSTPNATANVVFRDTITGAAIDLSVAKKGPETDAVKHFIQTGENLYVGNEEAAAAGGQHFLTACSGCHGHEAEGKLGPALRDDYWTYPKNKTDKGLFETIFNGAAAMMGPMHKMLTIDEMLQVVAWIRHVYIGDPDKADWLTEEQRKAAAAKPAPQPAAH
ncbi:MAG TPA: cytochrome c(L), periplasmic [Gammaproteobacteria bacterium]|nr:cytochrome c(L), periplasmic [Gammaproteobacteria bacterium]